MRVCSLVGGFSGILFFIYFVYFSFDIFSSGYLVRFYSRGVGFIEILG